MADGNRYLARNWSYGERGSLGDGGAPSLWRARLRARGVVDPRP